MRLGPQRLSCRDVNTVDERCSCHIEHPKEGGTALDAKRTIERDYVLAVGNADPSTKTSMDSTFADRVGSYIHDPLEYASAVTRQHRSRMR